ncbi:copper homeostasis protein [Penicillium lagena]|uniref:copper homeostasis protein n=1 Tax=Penicillium lagena TaxID=94218 RepID=UPI0025426A27|nr:copper homeostasis protein [Penicillium lagena]KAJ5611382.1 copper homeostasis protein [Penicillium lagena]
MAPRRPLLEIACFNPESALIAAKGGADRIELCQDYQSGGLSPPPQVLAALKSQLSIPVYVMIRPHSKSFCYDDSEFRDMKSTMSTLNNAGADGFVFGILNPESLNAPLKETSWIDIARNKELVQLANGRPCTFHRAFDLIPESLWDHALADIMECGFKYILTNGGPSGSKALECVDKLADLVHRLATCPGETLPSKGVVPEIIVGGGVRSQNAGLLWTDTSASFFHSAALLQDAEIVSEEEVKSLRRTLDTAWKGHVKSSS